MRLRTDRRIEYAALIPAADWDLVSFPRISIDIRPRNLFNFGHEERLYRCLDKGSPPLVPLHYESPLRHGACWRAARTPRPIISSAFSFPSGSCGGLVVCIAGTVPCVGPVRTVPVPVRFFWYCYASSKCGYVCMAYRAKTTRPIWLWHLYKR